MSDKLLNDACNDPKLARKRKKESKKQLRTVSELFGTTSAEKNHVDKRGRPWVANPRKFAFEQLKDESVSDEQDLDQDSSQSDASSSDSIAPEVQLKDLEKANFLSLVEDAPITEESTSRLALLHFDWDNGTAEDIFVLLESFLPPNKHIKCVTIYPSQYGIERMREEENSGPRELKCSDSEASADEVCDPEDKKAWHNVSAKMRSRLREYQLQRLKYFYAIIELDSRETAQEIYAKCDGLEYQTSGICLDLRFVDEKETFQVDPQYSHLVSECKEVIKAKYEPRKFQNKALCSTRVVLDWDKTSDVRTDWLRSQFKAGTDPKATLTENTDQLCKYIALSSSGSSTAASSDVDDPDPAPTVPRIRKHRPPKVPVDRVRALLLGKTTEDKVDQETSSDEEVVEEVNDMKAKETDEESYDLGSDQEDHKKLKTKLDSDEDEDLDFGKMEERNSDNEFSDDADSEDSGDEEEPVSETKKRLSRRAKMKANMKSKKSKLAKKSEKVHRLWHNEREEFINDSRFDEFISNPAFKISQTNPHYDQTKDFLDFIRHRQSEIPK
ncbi:pre-rRNA-processing protein esf1 [Cichlidogyrus casuarinus]|uniref:Pre-rRNA-processing protein esf1 n=1 Tax=Cichlidogyrus casuarinus TaxID=1844966 RepID=A0ABD2QJL2_9PLAT